MEDVQMDKAGMDENMFYKSYGDLEIHKTMLNDFQRTHTYKRAILTNYKHFYQKTVLDVGAGTGILSVFCAFAGAKKVYAVEASPAVEFARKVMMENKLEHKIEIIHKKIEEVELPEKVDVIVSEWMGYMLLYENMLSSIILARDKFLKEGGVLYPSTCKIFMAPVSVENKERDDFWEKIWEKYGVKMSSLAEVDHKTAQNVVDIELVKNHEVAAHAVEIAHLDVSTVTEEDLEVVKGNFEFDCFGSQTITGFCIWFSVYFPGDIELSTSPYAEPTHWQQGLLNIPRKPVKQGDIIRGSVAIHRNKRYSRYLDLELEYQHEDDSLPIKTIYITQ